MLKVYSKLHLKPCFIVRSHTTFPFPDYKDGFGGQYGVSKQMDKSAMGWEHIEKVEKHESQKGQLHILSFLLFVPCSKC